jgi:peptidyl-prolyl cis-trans isomerase D
MLDSLRQHATGWVAQIFIALLVVSFGVWGIADIFTGFRAGEVAEVGKTEITVNDFARQYEQAKQQTSRQMGQPLTDAQAQMFGLPSQVLGRLVSQATLDDIARQYGLGISNAALAKKIGEDPAFQGPSGAFDRNQFTQLLRNAGMNEDTFVRDQHKALLRYQVTDGLVGGAQTPDAYLKALHEYRTEARDISYVVLTSTVAGQIPEPTDAELTPYFDENKARWRAPEFRSFAYFKMTPADVAKPDAITDEQARADYDANIKDYSVLERRRVSQIRFDTQTDADAAAAAITGGKTFDQVATEKNLTAADTAVGLVTKDEVIDPKIADAAFTLNANTTSGVVKSDFGFFIVKVDEVQPGSVRPFDEVKAEIKQKMAVAEATRKIIQTYDEVEDMRAGGETLQEISTKLGVPYVNVAAADQSGNDDKGNKIADLPGGNSLLNAMFQSDVGIENDAVRIQDDGYVWYEVTAVTAERDRELAEVRDKVVADWKKDQTNKRVADKAEDVRKRLSSGTTLDAIVTELSVTAKTAAKLTRSSQPPADLAASAVNAAFSGPTGHVAVADGSAEGTKAVIVVVNAAVPAFDPAAAEVAQIRLQVADQLANDYMQQFLAEMQGQLGLSVNQAAVQAVVGGQQQQPGS